LEKEMGKDSRDVGEMHGLMARIWLDQGRYAKALEHERQALARLDKGDGPGSLSHTAAWIGIGQAYLGLPQPGQARAFFELALQVCETQSANPLNRAEIEFGLAQALWARPEERVRARKLAHDAAQLYQGVKASYRKRELHKIESWLNQH